MGGWKRKKPTLASRLFCEVSKLILEREAETSAAENAILRINRGIDVTGIAEETDVVGHAIFETATDMAETMTSSGAVSGAAADHAVRGEAEAEGIADEEVADGGPLGIAAATADVLLNTETDVFVYEVVDSETTTPVGTAGAVESASGECVNLKLLITEFAIRSGSHGFFEGLRRGACEGAGDGDSNCDECDCEFFHDVVFLFWVTLG